MAFTAFPSWDAFFSYFTEYQSQTFQMNLVAQKKLGHDSAQVSGWQVVVTHHVVTHNHPLDAETYMAYPQNRRVQDPQVLETVNALRKAGVKQRQIRAYLAEKAPNKRVTKSDVHNLLTKMKDDASYTATLRAASQAATPTATSTHGDHSTGGGLSSLIVQNSTNSGGNTANPLRDLSASGEISSGSFKLRVSRLEEQNLSLYAQNTTLREQNQQHATDLYEAHGKIREADGRLVALQKSESTLTEAVSALSLEVASLKAENARWKQQVEHLMGQIPAPNNGIVGMQPMEMRPTNGEQRPTWLAASQGLPLMGAGRMDMLGGSADGQETMSHLAKRPLGGGVSELVPPPKRPTTFQAAEENGSNGGDGGQRFSGGYVFSS
ncbi:hypothetical protein BBJ28_00001063 [Nothophytophthora sp. Chile5]|nr:hypothetical protein BBJ28_00001063 [Nothophytophthora sp. Chile5]